MLTAVLACGALAADQIPAYLDVERHRDAPARERLAPMAGDAAGSASPPLCVAFPVPDDWNARFRNRAAQQAPDSKPSRQHLTAYSVSRGLLPSMGSAPCVEAVTKTRGNPVVTAPPAAVAIARAACGPSHPEARVTMPRLVDLQSTELTPRSSVGFEASYQNRDADIRYIANTTLYSMETGRLGASVGLGSDLEARVEGTKLPAVLSTVRSQLPFPLVRAEPIAAASLKFAAPIGEGSWRYAVGGRRALGDDFGRQLALPDDSRYLDGVFVSVSDRASEKLVATAGAERCWLPGAVNTSSQPCDRAGAGIAYSASRRLTLALEALHEWLPDTRQSGSLRLSDGRESSYVDAALRTMAGRFTLQASGRRLGRDGFRDLELSVATLL